MRRTEMLMARWSRSKWIIIFPTGEDIGQDLEIVKKNVSLSTLRVSFTLSQMLSTRKI